MANNPRGTRRHGRVVEFTDFSGGLNSAVPTTKVAENELSNITNFDLHEPGVLRTRKGYVKLNPSPISENPVVGLHELIRKDGQRDLIAACGGYLYRWNGSDRTFDEIYADSTENATYGDNPVLNPSFENGDITNWTKNNNGTHTSVAQAQTGGYDGDKYLSIITLEPANYLGVTGTMESQTGWSFTGGGGDYLGEAKYTTEKAHAGSYSIELKSGYDGPAEVTTKATTSGHYNCEEEADIIISPWLLSEVADRHLDCRIYFYDSESDQTGYKHYYNHVILADTWEQFTNTVVPADIPAGTTKYKIVYYSENKAFSIYIDDVTAYSRPCFDDDGTSDLFAFDRTVENRVDAAIKRESSDDYSNINCYLKIAWYTSGDSLISTTTLLTNPNDTTAWKASAVSIPADSVPATTAKAKIICDVDGYYDGYDSDAAGHGYGFDKIRVREASSISERLPLDDDVIPSFTSFMGRIYISGYSKNIKLTKGQVVQYLPENPTRSKYNTVHKNRLWLAGDPEHSSRLYFTDLTAGGEANPDYIDAFSFVDLDPNDGDEITGLAPCAGNLTIFKHRSVYVISGSSEADWYVKRITTDTGCASHHSIANVDGNLLYLASPTDGVYVFDGVLPRKVSAKIGPLMARIVNPERSVGVFFDGRYFLFCDDQRSKYPYNDTCYVLSVSAGNWTRYKNVYARCAIVRQGLGQFLLGDSRVNADYTEDDVESTQTGNGGLVWKFLEGNNDDGERITADFTTGDMPLRGMGVEARVRKAFCYAKSGADTQSLTVAYASDRAHDTSEDTFNLAATGTNKWGVGEWGVARWENDQILKHTFVPSDTAANSANQFRLKVSTADTEPEARKMKGVEVYGFSIVDRERRVRA